MASQPEIFSRLKSYDVPPPPGAFQLLCSRLGLEEVNTHHTGSWQHLQQYQVAPPSLLLDAINTTVTALPALVFLQQHTVAPPADIYTKIEKTLMPATNSHAVIKQLVSTPFRLVAAAVLLMLLLSAIYLLMPQGTKPSSPVVMQSQPAVVTGDSMEQQQLQSTLPVKAVREYKEYDNPGIVNYFKTKIFKTEGESINIADNDFLITFASFDPDELPLFLRREDNREQLVKLDEYSFFTVTASMVEMLRKMYKTKSKGTPTRKARKEKEKLEKWKQADEKRFDQMLGNPLDPIDLADFLFK